MLETLPFGEGSASLYFLTESYYQMRSRDETRYLEGGAEIWQQMRQHVTTSVDRADSIYAKMSRARLGAWRVSRSSGGFRYEPIDGTDDDGGMLGLFCNYEWVQLEAPGVYVGWLLELGGAPGLFFAEHTDEHFNARLQEPSKQGFWGETRDDFRALDYEEDVLTLLLDPPCIEAAIDSGRYFLSSELEGELEWFAGETRDNFVEDIYDGRLLIGDVREVREESRWCAHCGEYHIYERTVGGRWSIEVAKASQRDTELLLERLSDVRARCLPSSLMYRAPFGRRTAAYLLPDERMFELLYLERDGTIGDDRVSDSARFRVGALPLEPSEIRELGLSDDWTIGQARAWVHANANASTIQTFDEAYETFEIALSWVSLMTAYASKRDEFPDHHQGDVGVDVDDDDWLAGLRALIPSAMQMRLHELDDPGRGTWTRIENALRDQTDLDRPVVRLRDLPSSLSTLTALEGIGKGTFSNVRDALEAFVINWPMSAGHHPVQKLDQIDASDDLQDGLDELDELF
jgi:hypothetical protein